MATLLSRIFDPTVRMLIVALALAVIVPVAGKMREPAEIVANGAVFLLFLLNGLRLSRAQVIAGLTDWRFHGALALFVFAVMGLAGWLGWQLTAGYLPTALALGFLYLGILPSTVQSATAYTSLGGGNVANAVVAAALINLLGVIVSPLLFAQVAGGAVSLSGSVLIKVATILLLPFVLGQILQPRFGAAVTARPAITRWTDRSAIAIAVYVAMSGAVVSGVASRIDGFAWALLLASVCVLLALASMAAWWTGRLLGFGRGDRIAFLFAGMQKSVAMGAPLATILFEPAIAGLVILPLLAYHFLQLVMAAPIAAHLQAASPD